MEGAMSTLIIIQARMASQRMPGKVLKPLGGQPALWWLCEQARQVRPVDDLAFDILDAIISGDAERGRHLRGGGGGVAGGIGPGHEMVAAEAGLSDHLLEGDVGGIRHRGPQRAADRTVGNPRRLQEHR